MFVSPFSSPLKYAVWNGELHRQVKKQRTNLQEAKHRDRDMRHVLIFTTTAIHSFDQKKKIDRFGCFIQYENQVSLGARCKLHLQIYCICYMSFSCEPAFSMWIPNDQIAYVIPIILLPEMWTVNVKKKHQIM